MSGPVFLPSVVGNRILEGALRLATRSPVVLQTSADLSAQSSIRKDGAETFSGRAEEPWFSFQFLLCTCGLTPIESPLCRGYLVLFVLVVQALSGPPLCLGFLKGKVKISRLATHIFVSLLRQGFL